MQCNAAAASKKNFFPKTIKLSINQQQEKLMKIAI